MQKLIVAVVIGLGVVAGLPVEAQAQATAKPQFIWNQQEREAVDAVKAWVNAWSTKDPQRLAELMADNSVFRADPAAPMKTGREAFVALITPLMLTEYFDLRTEQNADIWFTVVSIVDDMENLGGAGTYISSSDFKKESDGSKWAPTPSSAR